MGMRKVIHRFFIRKHINDHTLSEINLYEKLNYRISKNQKTNYPFKFKINENALAHGQYVSKKQILTFRT